MLKITSKIKRQSLVTLYQCIMHDVLHLRKRYTEMYDIIDAYFNLLYRLTLYGHSCRCYKINNIYYLKIDNQIIYTYEEAMLCLNANKLNNYNK